MKTYGHYRMLRAREGSHHQHHVQLSLTERSLTVTGIEYSSECTRNCHVTSPLELKGGRE